MRKTGWTSRSAVVGLVAGLLLVVAGTGVASASTSSLSAFATQSKAAGLTAAQAKVLQSRVDAYLHKVGGTQVAANEIRLPGDATLLVTLPGETRARSLTGGVTPNSTPYCIQYDICAWSQQYWEGDEIFAEKCGISNRVPIPFSGYGSYANWQTTGTKARFLDSSLNLIEYSLPAFVNRNSYPWTPVYWMVAC